MSTAVLPAVRGPAAPATSVESAGTSWLKCSQVDGGPRPDARQTFLMEVSGDLDDALVAKMRDSLFSAAASGPPRIVVDLANVSFVDAAGLRTLIAGRRRCSAGGTAFTLRTPSRPVQRLLARTHLDRTFDVEQHA